MRCVIKMFNYSVEHNPLYFYKSNRSVGHMVRDVSTESTADVMVEYSTEHNISPDIFIFRLHQHTRHAAKSWKFYVSILPHFLSRWTRARLEDITARPNVEYSASLHMVLQQWSILSQRLHIEYFILEVITARQMVESLLSMHMVLPYLSILSRKLLHRVLQSYRTVQHGSVIEILSCYAGTKMEHIVHINI
jgi:hypothetical protein